MARQKKLTETALNAEFYGEKEPKLTTHLADALNWYNSVCEDAQARAWLEEYFTVSEEPEKIKLLRKVPGDWTPRTAGWLARLVLRGYDLSDEYINAIYKQTDRAFSYIPVAEVEEKKVIVKVKPNVQQYIRDKASDLIGELEGMIDDGVITPTWSLYDYLRKNEVSAMITNKLVSHLEPRANEIVEALDTKDKQLKEGYKRYSTEEHENIAIIYQSMLDDAVRYADTAKKLRAPRKKKAPSLEKLFKHFKYAKSNEEYKLASIDPSKIMGASELWTFNIKTKVLSVFRAEDDTGLGVSRSVITKYKPTTSQAKKIGRKTEERIHQVLDGGKVVLRKLMDDITGQAKEPKRINVDTILLRIL